MTGNDKNDRNLIFGSQVLCWQFFKYYRINTAWEKLGEELDLLNRNIDNLIFGPSLNRRITG